MQGVDPLGLYEDPRIAMAQRAAGLSYEKGWKVYGNWCGPDWTGGRRESYSSTRAQIPNYYEEDVDELDALCEVHDKAYESCRLSSPCDENARKFCMKSVDKELQESSYEFSSSLPWTSLMKAASSRIIGTSVGVNPFPPSGENPKSCSK